MTKDEAIELLDCLLGMIDDNQGNDYDEVFHIAIDALKEQPEPKWIPCSERLPESGRHLVSCSLSVFSPQILNYDENNGEWFYDGCKSMDVEIPTINAWMPLPEPWRGEEHEAD